MKTYVTLNFRDILYFLLHYSLHLPDILLCICLNYFYKYFAQLFYFYNPQVRSCSLVMCIVFIMYIDWIPFTWLFIVSCLLLLVLICCLVSCTPVTWISPLGINKVLSYLILNTNLNASDFYLQVSLKTETKQLLGHVYKDKKIYP